jgi:hypothetical protein
LGFVEGFLPRHNQVRVFSQFTLTTVKDSLELKKSNLEARKLGKRPPLFLEEEW